MFTVAIVLEHVRGTQARTITNKQQGIHVRASKGGGKVKASERNGQVNKKLKAPPTVVVLGRLNSESV